MSLNPALPRPIPTPASPVPDRHSSAETRHRLLESAGAVFAQKGYQAATIREICQLAEANVAAVNYHFGDKERLYHAVFVDFFNQAERRFPAIVAHPEGTDPEVVLASFIRNFVGRVLDPGKPSYHGKIMAREMIEPTMAMDFVFENHMRPMSAELFRIVRAMMGDRAATDTIVSVCHSIIGQCVFYCHAQPVLERMEPNLVFDETRVDAIARHVIDFSLHAIRGMMAEFGSDSTAVKPG